MKKFLLIGIVVAVALIIGLSGCAIEKTYYKDYNGYCEEVATSDMQLQNWLLDSNYSLGACSTESQLGKCSYTLTYTTQVGTTDTVTVSSVFYQGTYYSDISTASAFCSLLSGTWTSSQ